MSPYVYAVYWLPPASSAFLLARKCNWLAEKMLITCVMRHARLQKLQRLRREWPFYIFLFYGCTITPRPWPVACLLLARSAASRTCLNRTVISSFTTLCYIFKLLCNCWQILDVFEKFLGKNSPKYCWLYCCHAVWIELFLLLSNILNARKENFIIDLINKFCCWICCPVISSYIIKELKKLVSCLYGVIMHSGDVGRILEKPVKHSATPRVLQASLVFSQHSPIVHYYTIKARDSFFNS